MKTLTLIGSFFLPGDFLASIFSMPFFDFSTGMYILAVERHWGDVSHQILVYPSANPSLPDLDGYGSRSLWIYFVLSTPLTLAVFGLWRVFDRTARRKHELKKDNDEYEAKIAAHLEARIMRNLRTKTGIRVADTGDFHGAGPTSGQV